MASNKLGTLNSLILQLKGGDYIYKKDLGKVLNQKQIDYIYSMRPDVLQGTESKSRAKLERYEVSLKKAEYKYAAAQRSKLNMKKLEQESEALCEYAIETLVEIISEFPNIVYSLDRVVYVSDGVIDYSKSDFKANVSGMPRHVSSFSKYAKKIIGIKRFRMDVALPMLESVKDEILNPGQIDVSEETTSLQRNGRTRKRLQENIDDWLF